MARSPYGVLLPKVIALHRKNPDWNSAQIAAKLGVGSAYVRKTLYRAGVTSTRTRKRNGKRGMDDAKDDGVA